ncbi:hypothetical protein AKO1_014171 [Acrasis kona]|uniref:t-SNARE coiled-coil homology domain-containing protein n=1 Tax=Acrasis kona TaxID=1008807 RepID=A0AAW2Z1J0_9EUKA
MAKASRRAEKESQEALEGTGFEIGSCTPGMSDLMRRLYEVRIDCGQFEDEEMRRKADEAAKNGLKRLDLFEQKKYNMDKLLRQVIEQLETKERGGDELNNKALIKNIMKVEKLFKEMQKIHEDAKAKKALWSKVSTMPEELRLQREKDLSAIEECIKSIKSRQKTLLMGGKEDKKISSKKPKFDNVDDLVKQERQIEIPTLDISEGLAQIEANKKRLDNQLDLLDGKLDTLADIANSIGLELDKQALMLDKMSADVDKYNAKLGHLNKDLEKAVAAVGGGTRLMVCGIIIIVLIALVGILYLVISYVVKTK